MKKSDSDFTVPQRQSYIAILQIIYKTINIVFRQTWPLLLLFLFRGEKSNKSNYLLYFIILVAIMVMLISIINYFKFIYYVESEELIQESGVFTKKRISIPFDRIQTVNFEQNILHRLFHVVKLKIDTAGSAKKEIELDAIDFHTANALRKMLLEGRSRLAKANIDEVIQEESTIIQLGIADLLRAGLVENHFNTMGVIFAFLIWIYTNLQDLGVHIEDQVEEMAIQKLQWAVLFSLVIIGVVIVLLISLFRMLIKNYNLRFIRNKNGFKIMSGLFTQRSISAKDTKIQSITWHDNLLQKIIGINNLQLRQAGSKAINEKTGILIPGLSKYHIQFVLKCLYAKQDLSSIMMFPIHRSWMYRRIFFQVIFSIVLTCLGFFFSNKILILLGFFFLVFLILKSVKKYYKLKYGYNNTLLKMNGGSFGDRVTISPIYKIQAIKLSTSPFQKARKLSTLIFYNASGAVSLPYVNNVHAYQMVNYFVKQVETSKKRWM